MLWVKKSQVLRLISIESQQNTINRLREDIFRLNIKFCKDFEFETGINKIMSMTYC